MAMNFSRNLTALRKRNNITQERMAEECGVSRAAIAKWETASSVPNLYMVDDIAKFFCVTVDELLHGEMENTKEGFDNETMAIISNKLDEMKDELISEIRKRDNNADVYAMYCRFMESDVENAISNDDLPIEAYTYLGSEEALKGNYTDALEYYEEAVIRGDINSVFAVLQIYEDMVDMYAYDHNIEDIVETRLIEARKMQQYGKIIEAVYHQR